MKSLTEDHRMVKKIQSKKRKRISFGQVVVWTSALLTVGIALAIVGIIFWKGIPYLTPSLFAWTYTSDNVSLMPALVNTLLMLVVSLAIALPVGVAGSVYLVEYAAPGNRFVRLVNLMVDTLAGIPSIVYGLFGALFFVQFFGMGLSLLAGALTLSIMVLPTIMKTTQEALREVPALYREGSYGLGAGKLRTITKIVLPAALPGILSGAILAAGRVFGESAALIFTAGTLAQVAGSVTDSARTMAVHLYALSQEGLFLNETYASAAVLIVVVLLMNGLAAWLAKKAERRREHG